MSHPVSRKTSENFEVRNGVCQACVLSPLLFNCFIYKIVRDRGNGNTQRIEYTTNSGLFLTYWDKTSSSISIQDALYADDLTLVAEFRQELQHMVNAVDSVCKWWGMNYQCHKD